MRCSASRWSRGRSLPSWASDIVWGAIVRGVAGAGALYLADTAEAGVLGRETPFSARRVAGRFFGSSPRGPRGTLRGLALRVPYAIGWSLLDAVVTRRRRSPVRISLLATTIWASELLLSVPLRLPPPGRRWRGAEVGLLLFHTHVFATTVVLADQNRPMERWSRTEGSPTRRSGSGLTPTSKAAGPMGRAKRRPAPPA